MHAKAIHKLKQSTQTSQINIVRAQLKAMALRIQSLP